MKAVEFTEAQLKLVKFCAYECELQMSGERSVAWMLGAWQWALGHRGEPITEDVIQMLGALVEPNKNSDGYRRVGVRVGASIKPEWFKVPELMQRLVGAQVGHEEWFRQYEEIHPFRDGNGRTGVILYNWRRGTLDEPEWAPDFWDDPRRYPGYGAPGGDEAT